MGKTLVEMGALRQLCHNNGDPGFVIAYDREITDRYIAQLEAKLAAATPAQATPEGGHELPPLPKEVAMLCPDHDEADEFAVYTADQMRDYARAALAARQQVAEPVHQMASRDGQVWTDFSKTAYEDFLAGGGNRNRVRVLYHAAPHQQVGDIPHHPV